MYDGRDGGKGVMLRTVKMSSSHCLDRSVGNRPRKGVWNRSEDMESTRKSTSSKHLLKVLHDRRRIIVPHDMNGQAVSYFLKRPASKGE